MNERLKQALRLASEDYFVFPLQEGGKIPRPGFMWKEGSTKDPETIKSWFYNLDTGEKLNPNIAIDCGKSNLFVIDVDIKGQKNGDISYRLLDEEFGFTDTFEVITPSGGMHYYYNDVYDLPNTGGALGPGIDTKARNGYVVAPGSIIDGIEYKVIKSCKVANCDKWLQSKLVRHENKKQKQAAIEEDKPIAIQYAKDWLQYTEPAFEGSEGDRHTFLTALKLRDLGCSLQTTYDLMMQDWNNECVPRWEPKDLMKKVRSAFKRDILPNGTFTAEEEFGVKALTRITVKGGGLTSEVTQAEAALIEAGTLIYQRNGMLVRPVIDIVEATHGRKAKVTRFISIDHAFLLDLLCKEMLWRRQANKGEYKRINPPQDIARTLLSRQGNWNFPSVIGIISTPTIRSDGSLLLKEGYDAKTRLYGADFPNIPAISKNPTKQECQAALVELEQLLSEFPFVDDGSRSVALSALITPVVRAAFQVAPMHVVTAPTPGTGKSYIFDIAAAIILGQPCPVMSAGQKEEETEKRLATALMTGQPLISLDNVNGELGGDILCQAAERPLIDVRILGKSERIRIEARSTIFANGNNIRLLDDLTRRVIICSLDSKKERPELRRFKNNPMQMVLHDRGKYIAAILTIVRGYIAAGMPNPAPPLASYDGWSTYVRSPLMWLGMNDPVSTMEKARNDDPVRQIATAMFTALKDQFGYKRRFTASLILEAAKEEWPDDHHPLRDALIMVAEKGGLPSPKELGNWLRRNKDRIVMNMRLRNKTDNHGHAAKWWIEDCG